ncbi:MAG: hypothetical protein HQK52_15245 [Oligoflexia bacterium]|nr:hypothetical protein [Oligoflexia bacterium]
MQQHNLFAIFVDRLNSAQIHYVVTGSVAAIAYGEPRVTHDIDLVVDCDQAQVQKIVEAFPIEEFYCPPMETLIIEIKRKERGHFNLIHLDTGFKADIYLVGDQDFLVWALDNAQTIDFLNSKMKVAPVEYVIVKKLEYYREGRSQKHLSDIKNMLNISQEEIDFTKLQYFISQFGLESIFKKAQEFEIDSI